VSRSTKPPHAQAVKSFGIEQPAALSTLGYTPDEVATAAQVSVALIRKEISLGELESLLIGDRRLIRPDQLERWLQRKAERAKRQRAQRARQRKPDPRQLDLEDVLASDQE
jgi:hypothetical protein